MERENGLLSYSPTEKAFSIHLILDKIITCIVKHGSKRDVLSCRLVSKEFYYSASVCLRRANIPLFKLILGRDQAEEKINLHFFPDNATNIIKEHTGIPCLEEFFSRFNENSVLELEVPPFSVEAWHQAFFEERSNEMFQELLTNYGHCITEIQLHPDFSYLQIDHQEMKFYSVGSTNFQILKVLMIEHMSPLDGLNVVQPGRSEQGARFEEIIQDLTQQIMNGSRQLEVLEYRTGVDENPEVTPAPLIYPASLRSLLLEGENRRLTIYDGFPNLTELKLEIRSLILVEGYISMIMEQLKATLKKFWIWYYCHRETMPFHAVRLPVMREIVEFAATGLQLNFNTSKLEKYFPKLKFIAFYGTGQNFRQWTEESKFLSVKRFNMCMVEVIVHEDEVFEEPRRDVVSVQIREENLIAMKSAFPHLSSLVIHFLGPETFTSLQWIFTNMSTLHELFISIDKKEFVSDRNMWTSRMLGITAEQAALLNENPLLTKEMEESEEGIDLANSIRNMAALETLSIRFNERRRLQIGDPIISDIVFKLGFFKMPMLRTLEFMLGEVSREMQSLWSETGRTYLRRL